MSHDLSKATGDRDQAEAAANQAIALKTPASPIGSLLATLVACTCLKLEEVGRPVCDCCLLHSADVMPMDGCDCDCPTNPGHHGRLSGRVIEISPSPSATIPSNSRCLAGMLTVEIDLAVFRCVTVPDSGEPVDCDIAAYEAIGFLADAQAMRAAALCCSAVGKVPGGWEITPRQWLPHGPMGGCAGGVLRVSCSGLVNFPATVEAK